MHMNISYPYNLYSYVLYTNNYMYAHNYTSGKSLIILLRTHQYLLLMCHCLADLPVACTKDRKRNKNLVSK